MHHLDPQLQLLIERWPTLSKAVQQQIMLLVGGSQSGEENWGQDGNATACRELHHRAEKAPSPLQRSGPYIDKRRVSRTWWESLNIH